MPLRKQSGVGVWRIPSRTKKALAPVASAGPWSFEVGELTLQLRKDYLDLVHRRISNI